MLMQGARKVRSIVRQVLNKHGKTNRFTVRRVNFIDLARDEAIVITIRDWDPDPVADAIKHELKEHGLIVMFEN